MIYDMNYWVMILFIMLMMGLASNYVQHTFRRYSKVPLRRRLTGAQAARLILDRHGLNDVVVERIPGKLTDHYDPRERILRLSEPVYDSMSVSAVGVAAHEVGHAIQDKNHYAPLKLRQGVVPLANFGSTLGNILIMVGLVMGFMGATYTLAVIGLLLYSMGVMFALITLPVEFNASNRALAVLTQTGIVTDEEHDATRKVLNAAALTYVAAAVGAILQLLYWAMLVLNSRD